MNDQQQAPQQNPEQGYDQWKPNVSYSPIGLKIEYEGTFYELLHPHTSQMGWEPTQTPALWKICHNQHGFHQPSAYAGPVPFPQVQNSNGLPYQWIPYTGTMPANAIGIPNELGKTFYVARAKFNNGIHPGYAEATKNRCYCSYAHKEVVCEKFEVLVCEPGRYAWVRCKHPNDVSGNLVIAGNENNGTPLYSCKCMNEKIPYFGKTSKVANCAFYGLDGKEIQVHEEYEILTYN